MFALKCTRIKTSIKETKKNGKLKRTLSFFLNLLYFIQRAKGARGFKFILLIILTFHFVILNPWIYGYERENLFYNIFRFFLHLSNSVTNAYILNAVNCSFRFILAFLQHVLLLSNTIFSFNNLTLSVCTYRLRIV